MFKIRKFIVNPLQENSFIISDETGECIFIDPGFYFPEERERVKIYVSDNDLRPVLIANTHCHFDHIMGVEFLRKEYNIPFMAHHDDAFWVENAVDQGKMFGFSIDPVNMPDSFFSDQGTVKFGNSMLSIIHIPGHSPGHVVFYSREEKLLITGDVLFYGGIGRTDFPGGDFQTLISGIRNKLLSLPPEIKVLCGHGPDTTLGREKSSNPFLN
jgi:hydroxyacylglutathione hydrolase